MTRKKKNPARTVSLRNFTGKVRRNPDGTVTILGKGRKANPSKRTTRKRVAAALKKYVRKQGNVAAGFYDEDGYFHPLRASYDYDSKRAGEGGRKKAKRKGKRK